MIEHLLDLIIKRRYPELTAGLHLPLWAVVVKTPEGFAEGLSSPEEPHYCVDVQLLNDQGEADPSMPVLAKVPLPVSGAADHRGFFAYPALGTLVEIAFLKGLPNKPFVRTVFAERLTVPAVAADEVVVMQSQTCYQRADGSWQRHSDAGIVDSADTYTETIDDSKISQAGNQQRLVSGGTVYVGNDSDNVLALLSELMGIVKQLASDLATHVHLSGGAGVPVTASNFTAASTQTDGLKTSLDVMVE